MQGKALKRSPIAQTIHPGAAESHEPPPRVLKEPFSLYLGSSTADSESSSLEEAFYAVLSWAKGAQLVSSWKITGSLELDSIVLNKRFHIWEYSLCS